MALLAGRPVARTVPPDYGTAIGAPVGGVGTSVGLDGTVTPPMASQPGVDLSRLYSGDMGSINPNAPPIFRTSDFQFNQAYPQLDASGAPIGHQNPFWSTNFGGMDSNNWRFYGGAEGNQDPNRFSLQFKNQESGGMVNDYTLDPTGQYYVPSNARQAAMEGNTKYGSDVWAPLAIMATGAAGIYGAGAGAAGGAGGGAATAYPVAGYGAAETAALPALGGGAAAGGGAAGGGAAAGGSGLFGSGVSASDAIQLGGLLAGAGGGGNDTRGGPVSRGAPIYADPNQQQQGPYAPAPNLQPPSYGSANRPASQVWQQYAQGLFNPTYQPPSVQGIFGMQRGGYGGFYAPQMRPVGLPAAAGQGGLLQQQPQVPVIGMPTEPGY